MKKYVAKEDSENVAVESNELPQNKAQLPQKNEEEQRQKKENTEPKKKKIRENRPQYNWNREEITIETEVPQAPKKLIDKPDNAKFQEQLTAYKQQLQQLYQKKQELIHEKNTLLKTTSENRKNGFVVRSEFSAVLKEKNNIKANIDDEIKILEEKRDLVDKDLNSIKSKINMLQKPKQLEFYSTEQLKQKIQTMENRLTTADLDKKQQDSINHKINDVKRFIGRSRSEVEIEKEIALLTDEDEILYHKLKSIKQELHQKYKEVKQVRGEIAKIMQKKNEEKGNEPELRTNEEIKADYEQRINKVSDKREKVKTKIDELKVKYNKDLDDFHDQQDLVKYIKFVTDRKRYLEEKKRKRQQEEERRRRENEQRQRRKQQRKKRQEERQERLKKQREAYINRNPYHEQLDACEYLINYCKLLKPQNAAKIEEKNVSPAKQLKPGNKDWDKQLKKGAEMIVSKKMKNEDEGPKKHKKDKRKKEKKEQNESGLTHHYDIQEKFEKVHLLGPVTLNQVDDIIEQLNKKVDFYSNPSEDDVKNFKERAQKEFDERYGKKQVEKGHFRERQGEDGQQEEEVQKKPVYQKKKVERVEQFSDQDFPELK